MALGDNPFLEDAGEERAAPLPGFEVFPVGSKEYAKDLRRRKGGLMPNRKTDLKGIQDTVLEIQTPGRLTDDQVRALIHRNPEAANIFQSAFQRRQQTQGILSEATQRPQEQPTFGGSFSLPGEVSGAISGVEEQNIRPDDVLRQEGTLNHAAAIAAAEKAGRFDLAEKLRRGLPKEDKVDPFKEKKFRSGESSRKFDQERKLRNDFVKNSKTFKEIRNSHNRVLVAAKDKSGASDLALIFNFMKSQDPESVVRESEFRSAATTGAELEKSGVPRKLIQLRQKVFSGAFLTPTQRADFVRISTALHKKALEQHKRRVRSTKGVARRFGLSERAVVPDLTTPKVKNATNGLSKSQKSRLEFLRRKQR